MADPVFEVEDLSVGYVRRDKTINHVVHQVSLVLRRGEIVGLAGESGCGKSTTALAAIGYRAPGLRILPESKSSLNGIDMLGLPIANLRGIWGSKVAYVAQSAALSLNPALTVQRQLAQMLAVHERLRGDAARARSIELLEAMGLPDPSGALRRYPFQFSGGQQQRVALAIALSCRPDVIILDEPTTGLDVTTQARITSLLRHLVSDAGIACLYVSHDLSLLGTIADRLAIMYAGELVESGLARQVASTQRHPYTNALVAAVPSLSQRSVSGIPGSPPTSVVLDSCPYAPRCRYVIPACTEARIPLIDPGDGHLARCIRLAEIKPDPQSGRPLPSPEAGASPLLEVDAVWCAYSGGSAPAVRGVSLVVHEAERVGIVGESGSGKSTLLRAITGLHTPRAGYIKLLGQDLAPTAVARSRSIRKEIQLVFQNPDSSLNPRHTIFDILSRPIRMFRDDVPRDYESEAIQELLDAVKLPRGLMRRYPIELSGGQRQRVALARAFAAKPKLLLCDEVTSALDVSVQATVLELVAEMSVQTQTAVLWISHNLGVVRMIASRVLVMRDGEVCEEGTTDQLFSSAQHPYTQELLAAAPELIGSSPAAAAV